MDKGSKEKSVDILIKEKKYTEAISIIAGLEQIVADNLDMTYRKIEVYMNSGHQIEALTEINGHYDDLKNDVRIMDLLLSVYFFSLIKISTNDFLP